MIDNLIALYAQSTDTDKLEGMLAYRRYHRVMRAFAKFYGFGIVPTVEAFAATSPNNDYHGNLRSMAAVLWAVKMRKPPSSMTTTCYNACAIRAYSYVAGDVSFLETVKGEKITVFRHNLLYPRTSKRCTVDGHMFAAWKGSNTMTMKEAALEFGRSKKWYRRVEDDIAKLARRHKMLPHQMQAILWITRKRVMENNYTVQQHFDHGKYDVSRIICKPEHYLPHGLDPEERKYLLSTCHLNS